MAEIWLHSNRRVLAFGLLLPLAALAIGGTFVLIAGPDWQKWIGAAAILVGLLWLASAVAQLYRPRLAYQERKLLVYLAPGPPERVPIEVVEGFLLGQGPTMLPGKRYEHTEASTLVIRLADAAVDFADRQSNPALGRWCGGYITLRGTWCQPLSLDLVNRLNLRLAAVNRPLEKRSESAS